ncbi:DUF3106 domain-containing protein [Rhodocyclus tenuis]|uniref:DUF3106 domain-containing protein n=1 Tax=Rhodocyclus tenuis TaxID=1066 RepID=UPI001902EC7D|nr:DUF3106 domain-containing protein [Rhodocyclus tenuis]MBK1680076.1 hypothetical protein [Rhodocyclus tenuis]
MVKKLLGGIALSCFICVCSWAGPAAVVTPAAVVATPAQPKWNELSFQQQSILVPLASDWNQMENYRRKKWLGIAQRFATMSPADQKRVQAQMYEWAKLTPQQRQAARERYQTVTQLPPEKKQELKEKWEVYVNLPEEEKRKLQEQAASVAAAKSRHAAPAGTLPAIPPKTSKPADAATVSAGETGSPAIIAPEQAPHP